MIIDSAGLIKVIDAAFINKRTLAKRCEIALAGQRFFGGNLRSSYH